MFGKKSMSNEPKWFVNSIKSETWDGKVGSPTVWFDTKKHVSLENARNDIRSRIGDITSNPLNKIEWIDWRTSEVQIRFNYANNGGGRVHQTYVMNIQQIDVNNLVKWVDIGD